jgi:hypothetical protein
VNEEDKFKARHQSTDAGDVTDAPPSSTEPENPEQNLLDLSGMIFDADHKAAKLEEELAPPPSTEEDLGSFVINEIKQSLPDKSDEVDKPAKSSSKRTLGRS